jgi:hypothetical protein
VASLSFAGCLWDLQIGQPLQPAVIAISGGQVTMLRMTAATHADGASRMVSSTSLLNHDRTRAHQALCFRQVDLAAARAALQRCSPTPSPRALLGRVAFLCDCGLL